MDVFAALEDYAFLNRLDKKDVVVRGIETLLSCTADTAAPARPRRTAPTAINHDFDVDDPDDVNIIIAREHEWLTGKAFGTSTSDQEAWNEVKDIPVETILIGMLNTTFNHRKEKRRAPINSFRFFVPQILKTHEDGSGSKMSTDQYIQYCRGRMKTWRIVPETWT